MAFEDDDVNCDMCCHLQTALQDAHKEIAQLRSLIFIKDQGLKRGASWMQYNAVGREAKGVIEGMERAANGGLWTEQECTSGDH